MSFMVIAVAMLAAFCLQFLFQMVQMKSFNKFYTKLRKKGRVAIGKAKRRFSCRCDRYVCDRSGWSDHRWLLYERIYNACTI